MKKAIDREVVKAEDNLCWVWQSHSNIPFNGNFDP